MPIPTDHVNAPPTKSFVLTDYFYNSQDVSFYYAFKRKKMEKKATLTL